MKKFLRLTLIIYSLNAFPQTATIDSLKLELTTAIEPKTILELIHEIAKKSSFADLDSAEKYANILLKKSIDNKIDFSGKAYHILADLARRRADYETAMKLALKADSLTLEDINRIKIYNLIGNIYYNNDKYDEGEAYYYKSIELALALESNQDVYMNYNNLAMTYFRQGKYTESLDINFKALRFIDSLQLDTKTGSIYGVIGVIYQNMGDYDLAYKNYKEAIKQDSIFEDKMGVITWRINWAIALQNEDKFKEAEAVYLQALKNTEEAGYARLTANVLSNLGAMYDAKGELFKSIETFERAYRYADSIKANNLIAFDVENLGDLYTRTGKFEKAYEYLLKSREKAYSVNDPKLIRDIHGSLTAFFEKRKMYDSAYQNIQKYYSYKDSLFNELKIKEIGKLEAEYEFEKQKLVNDQEHKKKLAIEKEKQKQQAQVIWIIAISSIIIGILLIFIFRRLKLISRQKYIIENQNKELEKTTDKLVALDIAKTNFYANISHDLRSPLTLILGSMDQVLSDENQLSSKSIDLLESGYRNSKKLLFMADEIRDLTRLQEGKLKLQKRYVNIESYLRLLVKMFSSAAALKNIILKFESKLDEDKVVNIDPHQFEKIIYNLLSNAVKHTEELGSITVSLNANQTQIEISIEDSGIGIPTNQIAHIFDRYYQIPNVVSNEHAGLGIGLALSKEILDLHGAKIKVESNEGKGSKFTIYYSFEEKVWMSETIIDEYYDPLISPIEYNNDKPRQSKKSDSLKTVLIVEDHREIRHFLTNILADDYNIILAKNGNEALGLLKEQKVDLIISDLMMPYMDGFELIHFIKNNENYKHLPILIVSARTSEDDKLKVLELGAEEIIAKPFSPRELKVRLRNILQKERSSRILDLYNPTNLKSDVENIISKKLEKYLLEHIDDPHLTVIDLSNELAASERKVYRLIKSIFNLTPLELIKETRWKYLEEIIESGKVLNASEAAKSIGYSNTTYFKKEYSKRFGKEF